MSSPYFLAHTNILIYATSLADDHAAKRPLARSWVACADWGLSNRADGVLRQRPPGPQRPATHGSQAFVERLLPGRPGAGGRPRTGARRTSSIHAATTQPPGAAIL